MKWKFWHREPSWEQIIGDVKISMFNEAMLLERKRLERKEQLKGV
jgi:hypothetical protein